MPFPSWLTGVSAAGEERRPSHPDEDLSRALDLVDEGRVPEATVLLESLLNSSDAKVLDLARNQLADIYAEQGRYADAGALLLLSLQYRTNSGDQTGYLLASLAVLQKKQGRIDEAELSYSAALDALRDLDPEMTVFILRNVETLYASLGRGDEADSIEARLPEYDEQLFAELENELEPYIDAR